MRLLLAILLLALPATAWAEIGRIKLTIGQTSVQRDGKTAPARVEQAVETSDVIITGKDGRIGIVFKDNSRFSAGPNSRIELTIFKFNPGKRDGEFITKLDQGTLAMISGKIAKQRKDAMKVRTPASILGVRGTKFLVKVDP
ncbi:MAG: FecR domain-containing protein [Alphaproteobacteria bacterium]|nr:FecR domain-containing protein [Alphaproteobacteria bacterium]